MTDKKMPRRAFYAESSPTTIDKLWHQFKNQPKSDYPWADKFVCGFPLPDFQRGSVWTERMSISFMESIWLGYDTGFYMLSGYEVNNDGTLFKYSDCVIDGQQRLTAIEKYWNDEFPVFGYLWSEITDTDRWGFRQTGFGHKLINSLDEQFLRDTYNRLNFSGVAHENSERA